MAEQKHLQDAQTVTFLHQAYGIPVVENPHCKNPTLLVPMGYDMEGFTNHDQDNQCFYKPLYQKMKSSRDSWRRDAYIRNVVIVVMCVVILLLSFTP